MQLYDKLVECGQTLIDSLPGPLNMNPIKAIIRESGKTQESITFMKEKYPQLLWTFRL